MKNRRIVVTGGAGFIGSNLVHSLSDDNEVIVIDDLCTGRESNIADLSLQQNVTFVRGSVLDSQMLQEIFSDVDFVFHQAAIPSVPRSIANPIATHEANLTGTLNVLMASRDNNIRKVVCASSSSVYGDTPVLPKTEDMTPNPQSPYAVSKLAAEYYCHVFESIYGLNTLCLRYFNVFGPRQDPKSAYAAVIPKFIHALLCHQPPIVFGTGEQTRDFTFVKDVVKANILAAESDSSGAFNIGGGNNRVSINDLAKIIAGIIGIDLKPAYEEARPGDIIHSMADISKARREFGYEPEYSLTDALHETVTYYKQFEL